MQEDEKSCEPEAWTVTGGTFHNQQCGLGNHLSSSVGLFDNRSLQFFFYYGLKFCSSSRIRAVKLKLHSFLSRSVFGQEWGGEREKREIVNSSSPE